jgi:membrane associated rhomboid family serine protease
VWALLALNVLAFVYELGLDDAQIQEFFYLFGIVPARYRHPEWAAWVGFPVDDYWPFLTSMFLHGGWAHILGNLWTLWIFGDNVEDRMGPGRFVVFYLLCGLAAGLVHVWTNPASTVPTVGASGAISGVMGAYLLMYPRARLVMMLPILFFPFFFEIPAFFYLAFWAVTQLMSGTLALAAPSDVGGVAWWAHVGGFAAGVILHRLFLDPARAPRRRMRDDYVIEGAWVPPRYFDPRRTARRRHDWSEW